MTGSMKKHMALAAALSLCLTLAACGGDESSADSQQLNLETTETTADTTTDTTAETTTETTTESETTQGEQTTGAETTLAQTQSSETAPAAQPPAEQPAATQAPASPAPAPAATNPPAAEVSFWDEVKIGGDFSAYAAAHPDYSLEVAESCIGPGEDRVYSYAGMLVITYFENGSDIVQEVDVDGGSLKTKAGVGMGSTRAQVAAAYGADDTDIYDLPDGTSIQFNFENGVVTAYYVYVTP